MGTMSIEVYEALMAAGVPEAKAQAAAEAIMVSNRLATKQDIDALEAKKLNLTMVAVSIVAAFTSALSAFFSGII